MAAIDRETTGEQEEVVLPGQCQICGQIGPTIARPMSPPPNQMCANCAIEFGSAAAAYDDET